MGPPLRAAAALGIAYRAMSDADLPFVAELYASTRREELAVTGWPIAMREAFLAQQHEAQHRHYSLHYADAEWLIVEQAGAAIGRLYLGTEPEALHIIDISLLPAWRGRGIGGAMLRDIIDHAADQRRGVSIHVEKNNPARRLYQRFGFAVVEDQGVYDLMRVAAQ